MKYSVLIAIFAAFYIDSTFLMTLPDSTTNVTELSPSTEKPDLGTETSSEKPVETEQESSKGFQLPNNTGSILPISNSSIPTSIAGFLDELAAAADSIATGVSQVIESATGIVQNASISNGIANASIPSTAGKASEPKAEKVPENPLETTSQETELSSPSTILPNHEDQGGDSSEEGKDTEGDKSTTPVNVVETSTAGEETKSTSEEKNTELENNASTPGVPDSQEQGLSAN